jgi:deoxyribodipyrimidine photo-lyase
MTTIMWFRQDLRVTDNPALSAAHADGAVVPVYVFAPAEETPWAPGAASRWWLHQSLQRLREDLRACGSDLHLRAADSSLDELLALARETGAQRVVWNRRYEPASIARDQQVKTALREAGIEAESFNSALLHEPWTVKTQSGGPFQVFTPFWRHCLTLEDPAKPLPAPQGMRKLKVRPTSLKIEELSLLPQIDWAAGMRETWTPGATAAHDILDRFLNDAYDRYDTRRDEPAVQGTSRLAPYLHLGEIGPREIWHGVREFALARGQHTTWRESRFLTEIGWREFAYHLLYHFPHTPEQPLRANYSKFPWRSPGTALTAWQRGATGYPIVDAGLRELWHTGFMHNRVRMIVASFLIKDLLINWTDGARWFWDTLVCADLASNTLGWQWVAGCGADAAPFFRIFNPITQGNKFDPDGVYVRRWIPELSRLPDDWIHHPWEAPEAVRRDAGVTLGEDYPYPIVDHAIARKAALGALAAVKI